MILLRVRLPRVSQGFTQIDRDAAIVITEITRNRVLRDNSYRCIPSPSTRASSDGPKIQHRLARLMALCHRSALGHVALAIIA